jgi:hypothetical protein
MARVSALLRCGAGEHRVTNIYQRENGVWKMIHHHSDTSPTMLDVLRRLQAEA